MKHLILFLIAFLPSFSDAAGPYHIVFDLHGILAYHSSQYAGPDYGSNEIIIDEWDRLFVSDYLVEVLSYLHQAGIYQVSILSNGMPHEITGFAKAVESVIPGFHFYRALSNSSPMIVGKDLRQLGFNPDQSLNNVILIDDSRRNRVSGQEENFLLVLGAETYKRRGLNTSEKITERLKLVWALGVIIEATKRAEKGQNFAQSVQSLVRDPVSNKQMHPLDHSQTQLIKIGFAALGMQSTVSSWEQQNIPRHEFPRPILNKNLVSTLDLPELDCNETLKGNIFSRFFNWFLGK
jgi:hypothetical protein